MEKTPQMDGSLRLNLSPPVACVSGTSRDWPSPARPGAELGGRVAWEAGERQGTNLPLLLFLTLSMRPAPHPPAVPFLLFKLLQNSYSCNLPSADTSSPCRQSEMFVSY